MSNSAEIVLFTCNWDGLSCVEAAAQKGLCYPASVKVVRVSCLSRIHLGLILKAFELGADAVMLLGCESSECHYDIASEHISHEFEKAQSVLRLTGLGSERIMLAEIPRGDGARFAKQVNSFVAKTTAMLYPSHAVA
ncbi:MAG: hydrogenase iron-sulfur subunit [Chloroflexota bacterium]|nr:hydrogenase iron-sulfur subunit [Chloroflexota bacterium]